MRLIQFGETSNERPGLLLADNRRVDVSAHFDRYDEAFFASGGLQKLAALMADEAAFAATPVVAGHARWAAPICRPSKIICVGLNYRDHAAETNSKLPAEPILFTKASSAFTGPYDGLTIPKNSEKTDWEVELAVVIGQRASHVDEASANDFIAGYALMNDYSERAWQKEHCGQWVKGKSSDTFAPLGPWLCTPDEMEAFGGIDNLKMRLSVNGETKQDGSTSDLIFGVPFLISYISRFMSLLPGDVIATGTPAGVGMGMTPPQFLRPGDEVELSIQGLGSQVQSVS